MFCQSAISGETGVELVLSLPQALFGAASVHPQGSWVRTMHDQWLGQQLGQQVTDSGNLFDLCLHALPHVPAERVLEGALVGTMIGVVDDLFETGPKTGLAAYVATVRAGCAPAGGNPDLVVFGRVMERARRALGPRLYPRLVTGFEQWANSMVAAAAAVSSWDGLDAYLQYRWGDFAFDAIRLMVEYSAGVDLTDMEESPLLDDLHTACYEHSLFVNDLFSYRKEKQAGDDMNAVSVLVTIEGMTLQAAVDTVCGRITAAEEAFFAAQARLLTHDDPGARTEIARYVRCWQHVLAGNLAWSLSTPRYNGCPLPSRSSLPTHMVLHPSHTEYRYGSPTPSGAKPHPAP